ncbi:hypothetical protein MASR2M36_36450 [Providencia sp.]
MLVPKYDNRYFGSIVEHFEEMARERGLFPIITCTRRDPKLEIEAARAMLSYQVDWLILQQGRRIQIKLRKSAKLLVCQH